MLLLAPWFRKGSGKRAMAQWTPGDCKVAQTIITDLHVNKLYFQLKQMGF